MTQEHKPVKHSNTEDGEQQKAVDPDTLNMVLGIVASMSSNLRSQAEKQQSMPQDPTQETPVTAESLLQAGRIEGAMGALSVLTDKIQEIMPKT